MPSFFMAIKIGSRTFKDMRLTYVFIFSSFKEPTKMIQNEFFKKKYNPQKQRDHKGR